MHRTKWTGLFLLLLAGWFSATPAAARTVWQDGTITRGPWLERHLHLEVNGDLYTLMPGVRVLRVESNSAGGILERPSSPTALAQGRPVKIRIQGRRIYEVLVY